MQWVHLFIDHFAATEKRSGMQFHAVSSAMQMHQFPVANSSCIQSAND